MKLFLFGLVLLASADSIFAQYLKDKKVKATKPVDDKCLALLDSNKTEDNCNFWKCFEERFPCGNEIKFKLSSI